MSSSPAIVSVLLASTGLGGCVTLEIQAADGHVDVQRRVGLLQVVLPQPASASIAGTVSGVGLVAGPLGWSLGVARERWALLGPDCRTVVWAPPQGFDASTRDLLARAAGVCLLPDRSHSAARMAALPGDAP